MSELRTATEVKETALRDETKALLQECTPDQVAFFHKLQNSAPWKGFANCSGDNLSSAYDLVCRTVRKNRTGRVAA